MENQTLKSNEEIRNQLLKIKGYARTYTADHGSATITNIIEEIKRESQAITKTTHGDKVDYCLMVIEEALRTLQNSCYSAMMKETQNKINIQILSNRLNKFKKFSVA